MNKLRRVGILLICLAAVCIMGACENKEENLPPIQGSYFTFNNYIHFYDEQLQKAVPLCFKADCSHGTISCDAYVVTEADYSRSNHHVDCLLGKIWIYQNHLYMVDRKNDVFTLCRYDSRGNNKTELVRLNPEGTFVGMGGIGYGMELIGDYFYYVVATPRSMIHETVTYPQDDTAGFDRDSFRYCIQLYRVKAEKGSEIEQLSDNITVYSSGFVTDKYFLINGDEKKITFTVCNIGEVNDYGLQGYHCEVWTYQEGEKKARKQKEFAKESKEFSGEVSWSYTSCIAQDGKIYFGTEEKAADDITIFRIYAYALENNTFSKLYEMENKEWVSEGKLENWINRRLWADKEYLYCYEGLDTEARVQVFNQKNGQLEDTLVIEVGTPKRGVQLTTGMVRLTDGRSYFIAGMQYSGIKGMEIAQENQQQYDKKVMMGGCTTFNSAGIVDKSCIGTGKLEIRKIAEYPCAK